MRARTERQKRVMWVIGLVAATSALAAISSPAPAAEWYFFDEVRGFKPISEMTELLDQALWMGMTMIDDGFQFVRSPVPPASGEEDNAALRTVLSLLIGEKTSIGVHSKQINVIIEDETFRVRGRSIPSTIPGVFPDNPELRQDTREGGLLFMIYWAYTGLGLEPPDNIIEALFGLLSEAEFSLVGFEAVIYRGGHPIQVLVDGQDGCQLPRDLLRYLAVHSRRLDEVVIESRMGIDLDYEGEEYDHVLPISVVSGFHSCPFEFGLDWTPPTGLRMLSRFPVGSPSCDNCPDADTSWYLPDWMAPDTDDAGELCWDLDYMNDIELIPIKDGSDMHVPVLDPGFDAPDARAWLFLSVLRDSGFRLLDTNNADGVPGVIDRYPIGDGFPFATYDGGALLVGLQKRRLGLNPLSLIALLRVLQPTARPTALAYELPDLSDLPDIKSFITNVHLYVGRPDGRGNIEVDLPELLYMIGRRWDKRPAYRWPHNFLREFPYLDLGERSPVVFEIVGDLTVPDLPPVPISMVTEAWAGYYLTNWYGAGSFFDDTEE